MTATLCDTCGNLLSGNLCPGCMFRMALTSDPNSSAESAAELPQYFAEHEILGEIARGGMGVVYRARRLGIDRPVALKIVRTGSLATPDARMRFVMEVEAISQLRHPHIISLFETGEVDDVHFFSMPLAEGTLSRSDDLRSDLVLLKKVVSGVNHAHTRGILHRDIKPSNILIDADGEPLLSDFGLVKHLEQASGVTVAQAVMGSPAYMAPEQKESGSLSTAADIFSLGVVLYELLTGELPADSSFAPDPRRKNAAVPKDLAAICQRCLEPQPADRYASAAILEQEIDSWLEGRPVMARSRSILGSTWLWARRNPGLATMVAVSLSLLLALAIGATVSAIRISKAQDLANSRLQSLQLEEIENLETSGRTIDSIARLTDYLDDYPDDLVAQSHLLSALGHRSFPVNVEGRNRRLRDRLRAAVWKPHLVTLDGGGNLIEWLDSPRRVQLPRCKMGMLNESADQALLVDLKGRILHWRAEEEPTELAKLPSPVEWAVSRDWSRLAVIDAKKTLSLWSLPEGKFLRSQTLGSRFRKLTFSPDLKYLAGGDVDGHLMLWKVSDLSGRELTHESWRNFFALEFSHDSSLLATGDHRGGIQVYTIPDGNPHTPAMDHGHHIHDLDFSEDDQFLVSASEINSAYIWKVSTGRMHGQPARTTTGVRVAQFLESDKGLKIGTVAHDGVVGEFEIRGPWLASEPQPIPGPVTGFRQFGRLPYEEVMTGLHEEVKKERVISWRTLIHPGGDFAAIVTRTDEVEIWDLRKKKRIQALGELGGIAQALAFHGSLLAIATDQGVLGVWDWRKGEQTGAQPTLRDRFTGLDFSPDGKKYLVRTSRRVIVFDTETAKILWEKRLRSFLFSARFSPDGERVVASGSDGTAWLWKIGESGEPKIFNHQAPLFHAAFSPCGLFLLTASYNNTVRLWDIASGRPLTIPILVPGILTGVGFHENGSQIVTTSETGTFQTWDFPSKDSDLPLGDLARVIRVKRSSERKVARDILLEKSDHDFVHWLIRPKVGE